MGNTKAMVDNIVFRINRESDMRAVAMHGDKQQRVRDYAISALKEGRVSVLVATEVAARGLDLPGIDHVINFDLPNNGDDYVHRIGRTGRVGNKGVATSFVTDNEPGLRGIVDAMRRQSKENPDEVLIPDWLEAKAGF